MTSGTAPSNAFVAAAESPDAIASSTLRRYVRIWLRRARFTPARRSILRTAFLADGVFAIMKVSHEDAGGDRELAHDYGVP